ncbi:MAG TPA: methyltransferase [Caulobacteraceae bacterium]|nr:methyltransferase [Caulobacteraceae bacterium]
MKLAATPAFCAALLTSAVFAAPAFAAMAPGMPMPAAGAPAAAPITAERPAADVVRDDHRKPLEVMAFVGVKPGMKVAELGSGGGYYTRMLSKAVGPTGKVYAIATQAQETAGRLANLRALAGVLGNVEVVVAPDLASWKTPAPVDVVWTTENYHDFHNGPTANIPGLNKAAYDNLKPGGVFYVEDHSAAPGAGLAATAAVHRMDEAVAKTELTAAGFKLDGETNLLRNPADNRAGSNSEAGSFVTDRFGLRMKK